MVCLVSGYNTIVLYCRSLYSLFLSLSCARSVCVVCSLSPFCCCCVLLFSASGGLCIIMVVELMEIEEFTRLELHNGTVSQFHSLIRYLKLTFLCPLLNSDSCCRCCSRAIRFYFLDDIESICTAMII